MRLGPLEFPFLALALAHTKCTIIINIIEKGESWKEEWRFVNFIVGAMP